MLPARVSRDGRIAVLHGRGSHLTSKWNRGTGTCSAAVPVSCLAHRQERDGCRSEIDRTRRRGLRLKVRKTVIGLQLKTRPVQLEF